MLEELVRIQDCGLPSPYWLLSKFYTDIVLPFETWGSTIHSLAEIPHISVYCTCMQWNPFCKTTVMKDHLSNIQKPYIPGRRSYSSMNCTCTCHQRPPVLRDHILMAKGVVFQHQFYSIYLHYQFQVSGIPGEYQVSSFSKCTAWWQTAWLPSAVQSKTENMPRSCALIYYIGK